MMANKMKGANEQPNKDLIDYDDIPKPEVERKDGLPTITELRELFTELFNKKQEMKSERPMPQISINIGFGGGMDKMGKTIDKIQGQPVRKGQTSKK